MSETRALGLDPNDGFFVNDGDTNSSVVHNPSDSEVAELLARVLRAAGHELSDEDSIPNFDGPPEMYRRYLMKELARWQGALARVARHECTVITTERDGQVIDGQTACRIVIRHHEVTLRNLRIGFDCPVVAAEHPEIRLPRSAEEAGWSR